MRKRLFFITNLAILLVVGVCLASEAPHQISVFALNRDIADFKDYVIMETALPIRHMENIEEVEIKPIAAKTRCPVSNIISIPTNIVVAIVS